MEHIVNDLMELRDFVVDEINTLIGRIEQQEQAQEAEQTQEEFVPEPKPLFIVETAVEQQESTGKVRYRSAPFKRRPRRVAEAEVEALWSAHPDRFIAPRLAAENKFDTPEAIDYFASSWGTACLKFYQTGKMERKQAHGMNYYRWKEKSK